MLATHILVVVLFAASSLGHSAMKQRRSSPPCKAPFARRHPEDKCNGSRMFYTPLLRSDGEQLGVCDSSCDSISDVRLSTLLAKSSESQEVMQLSLEQTSTTSTLPPFLFACNTTKTLPEDGVPEEIKDAFPYHMRTCFLDSDSAKDDEVQETLEVCSQKTFEQHCNQANGVFTNPLYKTW